MITYMRPTFLHVLCTMYTAAYSIISVIINLLVLMYINNTGAAFYCEMLPDNYHRLFIFCSLGDERARTMKTLDRLK